MIDFSNLEAKMHEPTLTTEFQDLMIKIPDETLIMLQECCAATGETIEEIIIRGIKSANDKLFDEMINLDDWTPPADPQRGVNIRCSDIDKIAEMILGRHE